MDDIERFLKKEYDQTDDIERFFKKESDQMDEFEDDQDREVTKKMISKETFRGPFSSIESSIAERTLYPSDNSSYYRRRFFERIRRGKSESFNRSIKQSQFMARESEKLRKVDY